MKFNKLNARFNILTGPVMLESQDLYTSDSVQNHPIGTLAFGPMGKMYRYILNGTSALVKGNTLQGAVVDTQFDSLAVGTASAVGDMYLQITNGSTTVVPTQYIGGTIAVTTAGATVALGDEYTITGVTGTLTTGGAMKVWLDRPCRYVYPTTTTKVDMKPSPWAGVLQSTGTTASNMPVGVAMYEIAASTAAIFQYGWVLSHGVGSSLCDAGSMAVGSDLALSVSVAGACGLYAVTSGRARIGYAMQASSSAHAIPVFLQID